MDPVKFGTYLVDDVGNITDNSDPKKPRVIYADRLHEPDWLIYLRADPSTNWNHIMPAYFEACERAGLKKITLKIDE